jgi:precorrin-6A/cobalt-precorrin-6A reductase
MTLLVLGGTSDALRVTAALQQDLALIYSVAGRVRTPSLACPVVSGGFSQFGGLARYVAQQGISAILDCTHPYAQQMSARAVAAAAACSIPCWRLHRRSWQPQSGDRWQTFADGQALIPALAAKRAVFLSAGQLTQPWLDGLARLPALTHAAGQTSSEQLSSAQASSEQPRERRFLLRTAVKPRLELPATMDWIQAIGPFNEADERALMRDYQIDALVSKNSGGEARAAKLGVARERGIPVLLLKRPALVPADKQFSDQAQCVNWIQQWYQRRSTLLSRQ